MKNNTRKFVFGSRLFLISLVLAALGACGGGSVGSSSGIQLDVPPNSALLASGTTLLALELASLPNGLTDQVVEPSFHIAPVLLDAPSDSNAAFDPKLQAPHTQSISPDLAQLATRRLTLSSLDATWRMRAVKADAPTGSGLAEAMATAGVVTTYTPAQIRAAYAMPVLPAAVNALDAQQAAQLGAGQTIYLIAAMHNPNVLAELAAFNQKFALPGCSSKHIAPDASLPLAPPAGSACDISVVYSTASGGMTAVAPAFNSGWATEIALDVQWAHATAPLARIILIEAADASIGALIGSIRLANAMGPGVVSMSFGTNEASWTAAVDPIFTGANMTYVAATGDHGAGVSWPAVSSKVVAVGGTTLHYAGNGPRSEVSWSGTGGGISQYTSVPKYQTGPTLGMGTLAGRSVADVAFNADPNSGQYVAVLAPGSSTVRWLSAGGTSLATPQWAGLMAVANATRALVAKPALGAPHALLYGDVASVPSVYAAAFADITIGSDGSCATCSAKVGYDQLAGLGTPNVDQLLSAISGAAPAKLAPAVTPASISGTVGVALTFTASVNTANAVSWSLSGAPSGMVISGSGAVTWDQPVVGNYTVTVTAKDQSTGLSGQGLYSINITAPQTPVIATSTVSGQPGVALAYTMAVRAINPVSFWLSGAPAGMTVSSAGLLGWAKPVLGSYTVLVHAQDSKTGLIGQAWVKVEISANGPVITAAPMNGVAGKPMTGRISIATPGTPSLSVSIVGAPMGMGFSVSGLTITAYWNSPVLGNYNLLITAMDSAGLSTQVNLPIRVTVN